MPRIPMVTRTILTTTATVFCINTDDRTTFEQTFILPRTYKDEQKLLKAVEKFVRLPVKPVSVISSEVKHTLYGMTEREFMEQAKVLPPREAKKSVD